MNEQDDINHKIYACFIYLSEIIVKFDSVPSEDKKELVDQVEDLGKLILGE